MLVQPRLKISYKNFVKARSISGLNLLGLLFDIVSVEIILNKTNFIRTGFPTHLVWYKLDIDYSMKYGIWNLKCCKGYVLSIVTFDLLLSQLLLLEDIGCMGVLGYLDWGRWVSQWNQIDPKVTFPFTRQNFFNLTEHVKISVFQLSRDFQPGRTHEQAWKFSFAHVNSCDKKSTNLSRPLNAERRSLARTNANRVIQ